MTTLLRIDASVRRAGSASRAIADQPQASWRRARDGRVIARDLAAAPPPRLDEAAVAGLFAMPGGSAAISDELIGELRAATDLLISTPMYKLRHPVDAHVDHVVRAGHTFEQRAGGYHRCWLAAPRAW